jgi:hypothetical protein
MTSALFACAACEAPAVQVLGESTRLEESRPSPRESAIFDGRRVSLEGARGETLGVQVRVHDRGRGRRVRLALPENAAVVEAFEVRSLEVSEPSSAMYGPSLGKGRYPDVLVPLGGSARINGLAYFDLAIPRGAPPGLYHGELSIDERRVPIDLRVRDVSIDLLPDPLVWVFYLPAEIARVHGLSDRDDPELLEREGAYYDLFRRHGALLAADLAPTRFEARRRFVHDVRYWPVAIDTSSDESIERDVHAWLEFFRDSAVTPFAIPVDEPHTDAERARAAHIARVIGQAGGGRPRLLRAVTDEPRPIYEDVFDVYVLPSSYRAELGERKTRGERFWTYNGRPPRAGSMILDTDGAALRTWGWIAERYDIELWYAWEGLYFSDRYNRGGPTDVMLDPLTFDERSRGGDDFGNGDGLLAYPGPVASLRLKALRRGLEDRLLLRRLSACGGAEEARTIARRVVPRALGEASGSPSWSIEEPVWESARRSALRAAEERCRD